MKTTIRKLKNPPVYSIKEWGEGIATGCYTYACNILANKFYLVGDFINNRCTEYTDDEELIETLKKEQMQVFNNKVEETTMEVKPKKNQFKICLVRDVHIGYYHFYRQNIDETWSDKIPSDIPMLVDKDDIFKETQYQKIWIFLITDLGEAID